MAYCIVLLCPCKYMVHNFWLCARVSVWSSVIGPSMTLEVNAVWYQELCICLACPYWGGVGAIFLLRKSKHWWNHLVRIMFMNVRATPMAALGWFRSLLDTDGCFLIPMLQSLYLMFPGTAAPVQVGTLCLLSFPGGLVTLLDFSSLSSEELLSMPGGANLARPGVDTWGRSG